MGVHAGVRRSVAAAFVAAAAFLAGCGASFDDETYDRIQPGMTLEEVEEILGAGEKQESGGYGIASSGLLTGVTVNQATTTETVYLWKEGGYGGKQIVVKFVEGKVASKTKQGF
jgi:hypothetical protein